ncbi:MAG: aminoglycoside phosphotransferase family protein [Pseudomonadota bacterium]
MERVEDVRAFLENAGWFTDVAPSAVEFLAAGEYNENWRVRAHGRDEVVRINHGSQLGLSNQISYEYSVLQAVASSGVTPLPLRLEASPSSLSGGALLMSYIEGRHLDYSTDLEGAAKAFAAVHSVQVPESTEYYTAPSEHSGPVYATTLLRQDNPVAAIAAESLAMLTKDKDHPLTKERARLLSYHAEIVRLSEDMAALFAEEGNVIANTEVNSSNFLVQDSTAGPKVHIVDWEKAVITPRYQDLGHFLTPTTTLWKTDTVLNETDRQRFLIAYRDALLQVSPRPQGVPSLDQLTTLTNVLIRTVLLRGLSWCFMAWKEYATGNRAMVHEHTRVTIQRYMADLDWFLR